MTTLSIQHYSNLTKLTDSERQRGQRQEGIIGVEGLVQVPGALVVASKEHLDRMEELLHTNRLSRQLTEQFRHTERQCLQQLVLLLVHLLSLSCNKESGDPLLSSDHVAQELDAVLPVLGPPTLTDPMHPRHDHINDVVHHPMEMRHGVAVSRLVAQLPCHDLMEGRHPTTGNVSHITTRSARLGVVAHKLVVVRVVDDAVQDVARPPRETRLTDGAPHLITPLRLVDAIATIGARTRVLSEDPEVVDVVLSTLVLLTLHRHAFPTVLDVTHQARIRLRIQRPIALRTRTGEHDGDTSTRRLTIRRILLTPTDGIPLTLLLLETVLEYTDLHLELTDLLHQFLIPFLEPRHPLESREFGARLRLQTLLDMLAIGGAHVGLGHVLAEEVLVPARIAEHALGLEGVLHQICLHTLPTGILCTIRAHDCGSDTLRVDLGADATGSGCRGHDRIMRLVLICQSMRKRW